MIIPKQLGIPFYSCAFAWKAVTPVFHPHLSRCSPGCYHIYSIDSDATSHSQLNFLCIPSELFSAFLLELILPFILVSYFLGTGILS